MRRQIWVLTFLICLVSLSHAAEINTRIGIPETPAGKRLQEWLDVFAGGNEAEFKKFIETNYAKKQLEESSAIDRTDRQVRTYLDARRFNVREVETSSPNEITVLAQADLTALWFRITTKVEPDSPHRITDYTSQRIPVPAKFLPAVKLKDEEFAEEIEAFVNKLVEADAFSGAVLLAKDGEPIFTAVHGMASKAYNVPNRIDTKFNIASVGKLFTSIAIGQLIEQKKISFEDPIGKHLTDYPNKEVATKVTIHHLLTHSSGLGDTYGPKYPCIKVALREVKDWFPLFVNEPKPLAFTPGEKWQYSNVGFVLLGAIVERVSGENFFEYIRNHLFKPAGMQNTDYYEADMDIPNLATGYTNYKDLGNDDLEFHLGYRRNTSLYNGAKGGPTGGVFSTLDDLLRFSRAFWSYKLMSKESVENMTAKKIFGRKYDASETYWGYGFELETVNGKRIIGHGGGDLGVSSGVRWFPDSGNYTFIVLSNYDRGGIITNYKVQELILTNR